MSKLSAREESLEGVRADLTSKGWKFVAFTRGEESVPRLVAIPPTGAIFSLDDCVYSSDYLLRFSEMQQQRDEARAALAAAQARDKQEISDLKESLYAIDAEVSRAIEERDAAQARIAELEGSHPSGPLFVVYDRCNEEPISLHRTRDGAQHGTLAALCGVVYELEVQE